jgi:hypothetical protein
VPIRISVVVIASSSRAAARSLAARTRWWRAVLQDLGAAGELVQPLAREQQLVHDGEEVHDHRHEHRHDHVIGDAPAHRALGAQREKVD